MLGTGILYTEDLQVQPKVNALGLIIQGVLIGDTTYQDQAMIINAQKGEYKFSPLLGVGIADMLLDHNALHWRVEIKKQLQGQGFKVRKVNIDFNAQKLEVDATY